VREFATPGGESLVHLHNVSGGILGGDRLALQVEVGEGARAQLTSTGATRVYRTGTGAEAARQSIEVRVARDGLLEYLPDPLIPFAGSRFSQQTSIDLAAGAGLFWQEIIAPGREASGEIFQYESLSIDTQIRASGAPIAIERFCSEPAIRDVTTPARLGHYRWFASAYICHVGAATDWNVLERALAAIARELSNHETTWGVSALAAHGIAIRGLSVCGRHIPRGLFRLWSAAKRALYGCEAFLPRKIN
jgi:urease accessory protein